MHLGYVPKISKVENVYLYTIKEFTHLFVDIKHMRPVTEIPVADLTFWFNGGSINMVDPFLHRDYEEKSVNNNLL